MNGKIEQKSLLLCVKQNRWLGLNVSHFCSLLSFFFRTELINKSTERTILLTSVFLTCRMFFKMSIFEMLSKLENFWVPCSPSKVSEVMKISLVPWNFFLWIVQLSRTMFFATLGYLSKPGSCKSVKLVY